MQMQDKLMKEKLDAKNAVEEYVYEMRDKIYTSLEQFVNEDVSVNSPNKHFIFAKGANLKWEKICPWCLGI